MLELELKACVPDAAGARARVVAAGGRLVFDGRMEDRRFDTPDRTESARDHVLRVRVYRDRSGDRALLDWKGPTSTTPDGYKSREEVSTGIGSAETAVMILTQLGYVITRAIDRTVMQYSLGDATVRFERYPRMDDLVEVEGPPADLERAIAATGIPRSEFSADRLADFVVRFERRTGIRAALCDADLVDDAEGACRA